MTLNLDPITVSLNAKQEFENVSDVVRVLKEIRLLEAVNDFDNQLFDLSEENSLIIFSEEIDETGSQNNLIFAPESNFPPSEADDSDPGILRVQAHFETDFELMKSAFSELLSPDDGILDQLTITDISFSFESNSDFQSIEELKPLFEATDHDVTGVQFKHEGFIYIFQQIEDGVGINVNSENTFVTEDHTFINEQLDQAQPFIRRVIQGDEQS